VNGEAAGGTSLVTPLDERHEQVTFGPVAGSGIGITLIVRSRRQVHGSRAERNQASRPKEA
jgi:hypothetical protein